jgi:carboxymethylenebutenolidase
MSNGVLVLHAWWGLNDDVLAATDRLQDAGLTARHVDFYAGARATTIDEADRLSSGLDHEVARRHIENAAADLGDGAPVFLWGYSLGGSLALRIAATMPRLVAGVVTFYGSIGVTEPKALSTPVIGHFAEHDDFVEADEIAALRDAGATTHAYPGTRHWFAEPSRPEYVPAAAGLTFDRSLEFVAGASGGRAG